MLHCLKANMPHSNPILMPHTKELIKKYIKQLSKKEIQTLKIAQEHLGSSFNLIKSVGFQKWSKNVT